MLHLCYPPCGRSPSSSPLLFASVEGASSLSLVAGVCALATNAVPSPSSLSYKGYSATESRYLVLKGIEMKATSVQFVGSEKANVLGTRLSFQKFEVVAPVEVQTSCNYVSGTFDTALARYTVAVAPDTNDVGRKEFMRQIKAYWKAKDAEDLRDYKYMPAQKFLWTSAGQYVLYLEPDGELEGMSYLFYTSGQIIRLTFVGFQSGGGWGGLSTFLDQNLRFRFPGAEINPGTTSQISPTQFWIMDKRGVFNKTPPA